MCHRKIECWFAGSNECKVNKCLSKISRVYMFYSAAGLREHEIFFSSVALFKPDASSPQLWLLAIVSTKKMYTFVCVCVCVRAWGHAFQPMSVEKLFPSHVKHVEMNYEIMVKCFFFVWKSLKFKLGEKYFKWVCVCCVKGKRLPLIFQYEL